MLSEILLLWLVGNWEVGGWEQNVSRATGLMFRHKPGSLLNMQALPTRCCNLLCCMEAICPPKWDHFPVTTVHITAPNSSLDYWMNAWGHVMPCHRLLSCMHHYVFITLSFHIKLSMRPWHTHLSISITLKILYLYIRDILNNTCCERT